MAAWLTEDDSFPPKHLPYGRDDLQLLGDWTFVIGVPWHFPSEFKKFVFAAAKTYNMGNRSVDRVLKLYGDCWNEFDLDVVSEFLFQVTERVKHEVVNVLKYISAIEGKPNRHGTIAAGAALMRLQQTFTAANMLIRESLHFETNTIQRLILEQLAWAYAIRDREEGVFSVQPQKCLSNLKEIYPEAGRLYGDLSSKAHLNPKLTTHYVEFSGGVLKVRLTHPQLAVTDALFSLRLADILGIVSESLYCEILPETRYVLWEGGRLKPHPERPGAAALTNFVEPLLNSVLASLRKHPEEESPSASVTEPTACASSDAG